MSRVLKLSNFIPEDTDVNVTTVMSHKSLLPLLTGHVVKVFFFFFGGT